MKFLVISLAALLIGSAAMAKECTWSSASGISVENVFLGNGRAAIAASGPGGFIETYNYKYEFTNSIVGFAATENFYNGANFHMDCNSLMKTCVIKAVVPKSSQMSPGQNYTINGVTCH